MQVKQSSCAVIMSCSILLMSLLIINDANPDTTKTGYGTYIDIHLHFSNQLMGGEPPGRSDSARRDPQRSRSSNVFQDKDFVTCADNMIALMDRYGLQKAVVMPQPRISGQPGFYDYEQILPAIRKYPGRLFLGGGGGTLNSMIHATAPSRVTDAIRAQFKKEALAVIKNGAKVFGEFAVLHVSLNPNHVFEEVPPDHPLFLLLADIAAEHDIPIDIHMEPVVKDTPTPANLRAISAKNPSALKANIPAFERLLRHNRRAMIVWQHLGWDNVGQMTISLLRRMLEDHPNLYLGFKIENRSYQVGTKQPMPNRIVDENMRIKPEWLQFFTDFADRILAGSDQFVGIPGRTVRPPPSLEATWTAIKQLPADVMNDVGRDNAARLYHLE